MPKDKILADNPLERPEAQEVLRNLHKKTVPLKPRSLDDSPLFGKGPPISAVEDTKPSSPLAEKLQMNPRLTPQRYDYVDMFGKQNRRRRGKKLTHSDIVETFIAVMFEDLRIEAKGFHSLEEFRAYILDLMRKYS